jgi:hypothetical protein
MGKGWVLVKYASRLEEPDEDLESNRLASLFWSFTATLATRVPPANNGTRSDVFP